MSRDAADTPDSTTPEWFEWMLVAVACVVLFGPLIAVRSYYSRPELFQSGVAADTVGVGVIMRAMLRRLLRAGARTMTQSAVGTVARASSRTMTRRVVRVGVKSLTTLFRRGPAGVDDADDHLTDAVAPQATPVALALGALALSLSLAGVMLLLNIGQPLPAEDSPQLIEVLGGMPLWVAVLLGTLPLLVYAGLLLAAAPRCGVELHFRTGWEALLLQAYFTGSGSYLPLSTDSDMKGPPAARAHLALVSLGGLLALHLACSAAAHYFDYYPLQFLAGMFLLFCFVYSFPLEPLDGYYLWVHSRWLWLAVSIPILASFVFLMPESLYVIL